MADNSIQEQWVPVHDFPKYEVSNLGYVRRSIHATKTAYSSAPGRVLKNFMSTNKYNIVILYNDQGKAVSKTLHRIVCRAFNGEPTEECPHVAHYDGNRLNCAASNLRWTSAKDNHADKIRHGTLINGEKHAAAILTEAQVLQIRAYKKEKLTNRELGEMFGVSPSLISMINTRRIWKHI